MNNIQYDKKSDLVVFSFEKNGFMPKKNKVISRLKCKKDTTLYYNGSEQGIGKILDSFYNNSRKLIEPKAVYSIFKIQIANEKIILAENKDISLESSLLAEKLYGTGNIAIFVATIGNELENHSDRLFKENKASEGFIYDAIGSESVESALDILHENLCRKYNIDKKRYSPGYPGWDIKEQKKIFGILGERDVEEITGVRLTNFYYMIPRKSVSGIIKLG